MDSKASWYHVNQIETIDSPALLVYPQKVRDNIRLLKSILPDVNRLRPHVKTSKIEEVQQLLLDEGITKFKCATIAEAEMLGMVKAPDVLLAYQPAGPKQRRLMGLIGKFPSTKFSCLVDDAIVASQLSSLFASSGYELDVWIDINNGMNRTGIVPPKAMELYHHIHSLPALKFAGIHVYDGHIIAPGIDIRKQQCNDAFVPVEALVKVISAYAGHVPAVIAGGSPTFTIHAKRKNVECSPGTFVFWDHGYGDQYADLPFNYAALLLGRVISIINDELLCLDLGYKAVASEKPLPRLKFLNHAGAEPVAHSEEHMVVRVENTASCNIGDPWYAVPTHICPTVALFDYVGVVVDHQYITKWKVIARDRFITV